MNIAVSLPGMTSKKHSKKSKLLFGITAVVLLLVVVGIIKFITIIHALPEPEKIGSFQQTQSTKIYDRTGEVLLYEIHGEQNRTLVAEKDIPLHAKQAVIAAEDQGFYKHSGIDFSGVLRAFFKDFPVFLGLKDGYIQGGSTITQQLVKNVFLTPEKTLDRKIKELILSYWIEKQYSKDQILVYYINQVNFGSNSYGIESAAQRYFSKPASQLSIAEAAFLAGILQSPSYYSPWGEHIAEAHVRKEYVLTQMKNMGNLTQQQYDEARAQQLVFTKANIGMIKAPHFVLMVKDYLAKKYGEDVLERGGLKVITTIDWKKQEIAERVVKEGAEKNNKAYKGTNAALVAQDAKTGQILSLVGSADYFNEEIDGNFNVVTQGLRQPGSTFKPIVYMTAFMKGYLPETVVFDVLTNFNTSNDSQYSYTPHNFDGIFRGPVNLKTALAQSINVPAVKVLYLAGMKNVLKTAHEIGITTLTDPARYGLSLVLGGGEVKMIDLIQAYSVFAQEGVKHTQASILKVEDNSGKVLEEYKDEAIEVVDPQYPRMINSILSNTELRSGLFHSSLPLTIFEGHQVALKTGTTNDYKDAWTMGYTPSIVVGVWAGNSNNKAMQQQGSSILAALPMFSAFMREILPSYPSEDFTPPQPQYSDIPGVGGQYVSIDPNTNTPQIHSILYYIDKDEPQTYPNPSYDHNREPQFSNWETAIQSWLLSHQLNLSTLPQPIPSPETQ